MLHTISSIQHTEQDAGWPQIEEPGRGTVKDGKNTHTERGHSTILFFLLVHTSALSHSVTHTHTSKQQTMPIST